MPGLFAAYNPLVRVRNPFVAGKEPSLHKWNSERAQIAWIGPARQRVGLIREQMAESVLICVAGGVSGIVLSLGATEGLARVWKDLAGFLQLPNGR